MPMIVTSAYAIAIILRITRSSILEVMGEDYVRTARRRVCVSLSLFLGMYSECTYSGGDNNRNTIRLHAGGINHH